MAVEGSERMGSNKEKPTRAKASQRPLKEGIRQGARKGTGGDEKWGCGNFQGATQAGSLGETWRQGARPQMCLPDLAHLILAVAQSPSCKGHCELP